MDDVTALPMRATHADGVIERALGKHLIKSWLSDGHRRGGTCPGCGETCTTVAITAVVYTFATCRCDSAPYAHLVEQLWHRACFKEHAPDEGGDFQP